MTPGPRDPLERVNKRLTAGLDDVNERIDQGFSGLRSVIDDLVVEIRKGDAATNRRLEEQTHALQSSLGQVEVGVGDLRDRVKMLEDSGIRESSAGAAEGAARGAGQAAGLVAVATAKVTAAEVAKGFWRTTAGKIVAVGTAIAAIGAGIDNLPKVIKWAGEALKFLSSTAK